jgi:hypothetical protein
VLVGRISHMGKGRRRLVGRLSLLDQCETHYSKDVSLVNEMRDTPLVRVSPVLGKGRCAY